MRNLVVRASCSRMGLVALVTSLGGPACNTARTADPAELVAKTTTSVAVPEVSAAPLPPQASTPGGDTSAPASGTDVRTPAPASSSVDHGSPSHLGLDLRHDFPNSRGYGAPPVSSSAVPRVRSNVSLGAASASASTIGNSARVVAGMRAGFRNCYQRALVVEPSQQGRLTLILRVAATGAVEQVTSEGVGTLSDALRACVQARAHAAVFDPPRSGPTTFTFPVTFTRDG